MIKKNVEIRRDRTCKSVKVVQERREGWKEGGSTLMPSTQGEKEGEREGGREGGREGRG